MKCTNAVTTTRSQLADTADHMCNVPVRCRCYAARPVWTSSVHVQFCSCVRLLFHFLTFCDLLNKQHEVVTSLLGGHPKPQGAGPRLIPRHIELSIGCVEWSPVDWICRVGTHRQSHVTRRPTPSSSRFETELRRHLPPARSPRPSHPLVTKRFDLAITHQPTSPRPTQPPPYPPMRRKKIQVLQQRPRAATRNKFAFRLSCRPPGQRLS